MKIRNVLSLFDGISCGQLALHRAGIEYDTYYASEIEKQPIWITQYNFPKTIQLGDVEKWRDWDIEWDKIDLLIGGSPCTNLSIAGNREGLKGEQSRLFYAYVEILNHLKKFNPNIKFLLENVESMSDSDKGIINSHMGCKPIMINSSLVSAQNRKRYYWFNWCLKKESLFGIPTCSIPQPEDKHILLKDILETGMASMDKSVTLCARDYKGMGADPINRFLNHQPQAYACEPICVNSQSGRADGLAKQPSCVNSQSGRADGLAKQPSCADRVYDVNGKSVALASGWKQNIAEPVCDYVSKKYDEFSKKKGYVPEIFSPYNMTEVKEKSPTLTTSGCGPTNINGLVLFENVESFAGRIVGRQLDKNGKRVSNSENEFNQIVEVNSNSDKTNTLTTVQKDNVVIEKINASCLRYERTEEGKKLRKQYENGEIKHGYNEHRMLSPRTDGKTNTLTTVEKDNMIVSDIGITYFRDFGSKGKILTDEDEKVQTLTAAMGCGGGNVPAIATVLENTDNINNKIYKVRGKSVCLNKKDISDKHTYPINLPDGDYVIRKLTPIECERLQTVPDNYTKFGFDGTKNIKISNAARYKALGNGWTIDIISHILSFLV